MIENKELRLKQDIAFDCGHCEFTIEDHQKMLIKRYLVAELGEHTAKRVFEDFLLLNFDLCDLFHGFEEVSSYLWRYKDPDLCPNLPLNRAEVTRMLEQHYLGNYWHHQKKKLLLELKTTKFQGSEIDCRELLMKPLRLLRDCYYINNADANESESGSDSETEPETKVHFENELESEIKSESESESEIDLDRDFYMSDSELDSSYYGSDSEIYVARQISKLNSNRDSNNVSLLNNNNSNIAMNVDQDTNTAFVERQMVNSNNNNCNQNSNVSHFDSDCVLTNNNSNIGMTVDQDTNMIARQESPIQKETMENCRAFLEDFEDNSILPVETATLQSRLGPMTDVERNATAFVERQMGNSNSNNCDVEQKTDDSDECIDNSRDILSELNPNIDMFQLNEEIRKNKLVIKVLRARTKLLEMVRAIFRRDDHLEERFYYGNNGSHEFQVFTSKRLIQILFDHPCLVLDGTFSICPVISKKAGDAYRPYEQLLTINALIEPKLSGDTSGGGRMSELLPVAFILAPSKKQVDYNAIFTFFRDICHSFGFDFKTKPTFATSIDAFRRIGHADYEFGLRAEALLAFSLERVKGCFSHFAGALRKNAQHYKILKFCRRNADFRKAWAQLKCVGLLPITMKRKGVALVRENMIASLDTQEAKDAVNKFFDEYFMRTWFKLFGTNDWHWFLDKNRTTNLLETKHKHYKDSVGTKPSIFKFVEYIQRVAALSLIRYKQLKKYNFKKTKIRSRKRRDAAVQLQYAWQQILMNSDEHAHIQMEIATFLSIASLACKERTTAAQHVIDEHKAKNKKEIENKKKKGAVFINSRQFGARRRKSEARRTHDNLYPQDVANAIIPVDTDDTDLLRNNGKQWTANDKEQLLEWRRKITGLSDTAFFDKIAKVFHRTPRACRAQLKKLLKQEADAETN